MIRKLSVWMATRPLARRCGQPRRQAFGTKLTSTECCHFCPPRKEPFTSTLPQAVMLYIVIVHPAHHGVLVIESGCLPLYHWRDEYDFFCDSYQSCERMKSELKAPFDLNFLRYEATSDEDLETTVALLEIPFDRAPTAPPTYKRLPAEDVDKISVTPPNESVTAFLRLYKTQRLRVNEGRLRPYSKERWFASACEWIRDRVGKLTETKVVKIVKISAASNACVLRAQTANGSRFFMKSVMKEAYDEVQITKAIHKVMKDQFGDILFVDEERRFMLLRDYGTPMVSKDCYLSCNAENARVVMRQWVDVQKKSVTLVEELCSAGVRWRGAVELQAELEVVVSDPDWFEAQLIGLKGDGVTQEFTHGEYKALSLSSVAEDLETVEKLKLPLCLVHGDLLPVNTVKQRSGEFSFFDFEGAIVSHPFLDAMNFLFWCKEFDDVLFEDVSFYLGLWGLVVAEEERGNVLSAMRNIERYMGVLMNFADWRDADESSRKLFYEEMSTPVHRLFKAK